MNKILTLTCILSCSFHFIRAQGFIQNSPFSRIESIFALPDGSALVGGSVKDASNVEQAAVARYAPNGRIIWLNQKSLPNEASTGLSIFSGQANQYYVLVSSTRYQANDPVPIAIWQMDTEGNTLSFISSQKNMPRDACLTGDTLWLTSTAGYYMGLEGYNLSLDQVLGYGFYSTNGIQSFGIHMAQTLACDGSGTVLIGGTQSIPQYMNNPPSIVGADALIGRYHTGTYNSMSKTYPDLGERVMDLALLPNGHACAISKVLNYFGTAIASYLFEVDENLSLLWSETFDGYNFERLAKCPDGSGWVVLAGKTGTGSNCTSLLKIGPNGNLLWERSFGCTDKYALSIDPDGNIWFSIRTTGVTVRLIKTDPNGWPLSNYITGVVYEDNDGDCIYTPGIDQALAGHAVSLTPEDGDAQETVTNALGEYAFSSDTGVQHLNVFLDNPNYIKCIPNPTYYFSSTYDTINLNLGFRDTCPDLTLTPYTDVLCGTGQLKAAFKVEGVFSDLSFHWNNGSTDSLLNNLNAGTYSVTVNDGGCETYGSVTVLQNVKAFSYRENHYGTTNSEIVSNFHFDKSDDNQRFYSAGFVSTSGLDVDTLRGPIDIWVTAVDQQGDLIWSKTYGGSKYDMTSDVCVLSNGSIALVGTSDSHDGIFSDNQSGQRNVLLVLSPTGDVLESSSVPVFFPGQIVDKIAAGPGGSLVVGGKVNVSTQANSDTIFVWMAKRNASGIWEWSKKYSKGRSIYTTDLIQDLNGGFVFNFNNQRYNVPLEPEVYAIKVDANGNLLWKNFNQEAGLNPIRQMPDGSYLTHSSASVNGTYVPKIIHITPAGVIDAGILLPLSETNKLQDFRQTENGWSLLKIDQQYHKTAEIVYLDSSLNYLSTAIYPANNQKDLMAIYPVGKDSFLLAGAINLSGPRGTDVLYDAVWNLQKQDGLFPQADTTVCPGSVLPFYADTIGGMFSSLSWQFTGAPLPAEIVVGNTDTTLQILLENTEGCHAVAVEKVAVDQFKVTPEIDGAACTLNNGKVFLSISDPIGSYHVQWADGNYTSTREDLAPGIYHVTVSDAVCSYAFSPEIAISEAPLSGTNAQLGFLSTIYGWQSDPGNVMSLQDGSLIYWCKDLRLLKTISGYQLRDDRFLNAKPLKNNTLAVLVSKSSNTSESLRIYNNQLSVLSTAQLPVDYASDLAELPTGEILVTGYNYESSSGISTPVMIKLSADHTVLWTRQFPTPLKKERGLFVKALPNGGIVMAIHSEPASTYTSDLRIIMFDAGGNALWDRYYGGSGGDEWSEFFVLPDGDLLGVSRTSSTDGDLAGINTSSSGTWVFRLSALNGDFQWSKTLPGSGWRDHPGIFPNGTLVFPSSLVANAGTTEWTGYERLTAFEPVAGNQLWSKRVRNTVLLYGTPYCTPGGDIVWPHWWWNNYHQGPSDGHCCPFADFYLEFDYLQNTEIPEPFELGVDTTLCIGDTLHLSLPIENEYVIWSDNTYGSQRNITRAGVYVARAGGVCPYSDTVRVNYCLYQPLPDSLTGCSPIRIDGGMPGLAHEWSNGSVDEKILVTQSGLLTLKVTDLDGITISDSVFLHVYPVSSFTTGQEDIQCHGDVNGLLSITPSGEGMPYTYLWSTGETDSLLTNLGAGEYSVIVTDAFGCTYASGFELVEREPWSLGLGFYQNSDTSYRVYPLIDGFYPDPPVNFLWSDGSTQQNATALPGPISLTVTDGYGCTHAVSSVLPEIHSSTYNLNNHPFSISPNPFQDGFSIGKIDAYPENMLVSNAAGQIIPASYELLTEGPSGKWTVIFNAQNWPAGCYLVQWQSGNAVYSARVIKITQ